MDHIGIDVHKRESPIYILAEGGEIIEQRIRTEPERFAAVLGTRPRARILIEASTDSEWVARCLEALGGIANITTLRRRGRPVRGPRHPDIVCQTQTLAAQEPDATAVLTCEWSRTPSESVPAGERRDPCPNGRRQRCWTLHSAGGRGPRPCSARASSVTGTAVVSGANPEPRRFVHTLVNSAPKRRIWAE
jgi:hypothetical protein